MACSTGAPGVAYSADATTPAFSGRLLTTGEGTGSSAEGLATGVVGPRSVPSRLQVGNVPDRRRDIRGCSNGRTR